MVRGRLGFSLTFLASGCRRHPGLKVNSPTIWRPWLQRDVVTNGNRCLLHFVIFALQSSKTVPKLEQIYFRFRG